MAVEGENLGTATIYLTVDKSSMDATIGKAKLELAGMGAEASKQYEAASAGQRKLAESLVRQAESIGKTRAEQIAYNAQLKIGGALGDEIAAKAVANAQKITGAQQASAAAASAAADKFAVSAEERAAQEERYAAVMAAERAKAVEDEAARAAAAEARAATVGEADAAELAAFNATVRAKQALMLQLNTAMASGLTTQREIAVAEDALDAAMAGRALTQKEQLGYITALDAAEERLAKLRLASAETINVETASLDANTAAVKLNSRTQYEIGVLGGEIASGNVSRVKRSIPALLNASGLTTKLMSPAGLGVLGGTAAIGTLVLAYVQAEKEANNFTRAIYATGQQGVITADQMEALAGTVGDSTGSYKSAAQALDLLVSSGKYTSDQYELLTRTLVNFQSLTGGSLQEGLQAIDSLNGQVGDGLVKLNGQYHFLTDTVYEQIAALQAQGQTEQARDLERKAFADGINQSADDIKAHLDPLAKAWDAVGNAASSAWHKMGQDVREQANNAITSIQTYFSDLGDLLDRIKHPIATVMNGGLSPQEVARSQTASSASDNAQKATLNKQATQTLAELGAEAGKFRSAAQKRADEIVDVVNRTNAAIAKALAAGDKDLADKLRVSGAKLEEEIAVHGLPKTKKHKSDPAATALATFQSQVNGLDTRSIGVAGSPELTKYVQGVAKLNDEFDKAIAKGADVTKATALFDQGVAALNRTLDTSTEKLKGQEKAAIDGYKAALDKSNDALQRSVNNQIAKVGMGDKEYQLQMQINEAYQQEAEALQKLEQQRETNTGTRGAAYADAVYQQDVANLRAATDRKVQIIQQGYAEMDAAQSNWVNGAIAAMQNWADQGANVADQTKTLFTDAFSNMNDALVNFSTTGKLSFKSMVTSILTDLARMELRIAESQILQAIIGAFMPSGHGIADSYMSGGGASYAASGVNWNVGTLGNALGGVYSSPSLSRYSGGVYDKPHFFAFANGGVFGEAGPEAIMPLSRGRDGKLGVKAAGGGNTININTNVVVDQNGARSSTSSDSSDTAARQLGAMMEAKAKEVVSRAVQPGGILWRHGVGQAA